MMWCEMLHLHHIDGYFNQKYDLFPNPNQGCFLSAYTNQVASLALL